MHLPWKLLALGGAAWAAARRLRARRALRWEGRHVMLSGGSRGLGLVLARHLAAAGAHLTLLARTESDLEQARDELTASSDVNVLALPCDVSDREQVEEAIAKAVVHHGRLDALVHDAGVIEVGPERHMDEDDYREAMGVHFWGARYLTEAVRPHLPRGGHARIAYISSIGGRVAVPHLAPYAVSKHALVGYADAMRAELAPEGIRVTTVTPGLMRTGSHPNVKVKGQHEQEYALFAASDASPLLSIDADEAAAKILDAARHGDAALTLTLPAKVAAALDGVFPGAVGAATKLVARLLPRPADASGDEAQSGWASFSRLAPSPLTRPADEAVAENNELRGHAPPA